MMKTFLIAVAAVAGLTAAASTSTIPAAAQGFRDNAACMPNNRIYGWDVLNDRAMVVSEHNGHKVLVHLGPGCNGLKFTGLQLAFRHVASSNLGCMTQGDQVAYRDFGGGPRQSCVITGIEAFSPAAVERAKQDYR